MKTKAVIQWFLVGMALQAIGTYYLTIVHFMQLNVLHEVVIALLFVLLNPLYRAFTQKRSPLLQGAMVHSFLMAVVLLIKPDLDVEIVKYLALFYAVLCCLIWGVKLPGNGNFYFFSSVVIEDSEEDSKKKESK